MLKRFECGMDPWCGNFLPLHLPPTPSPPPSPTEVTRRKKDVFIELQCSKLLEIVLIDPDFLKFYWIKA